MIWNNLCRYAGPGRNAEAPIERENKPNDGHNHGRLPNPLGLLPLVDSFATGDVWNVIAVLVNSLSVGAYLHFVRKERAARNSKLAD